MNSHECPATFKNCKVCKTEQEVGNFSIAYQGKAGPVYAAKCKNCTKAYSAEHYARNREKRLAQCADYREQNAEKIAAGMQDWYRRNKERVLDMQKTYRTQPVVIERDRERQRIRYSENRDQIRTKQNARNQLPNVRQMNLERGRQHYLSKPDMYYAKSAERRAMRARATVEWADAEKIKAIYDEAKRTTLETGVKHVVDHIIPLKNEFVCGLHVAENLQVLTEKANLSKSNKFEG